MIKGLLSKLEQEMTPIVAYGLIGIALIIVYFAGARAADTVTDMSNRVVAAEQELAVLKSLEQQDIWTDRLAKVNDMKVAVNRKLWTGETPGIISAELQQVLRKSAEGLSNNPIQTNVDATFETLGEVSIINFDARARFTNPESSIKFLGILSQEKRDVFLKDVTVRMSSADSSDVNISGFIPVQITETKPDA